MVVMILAAWTYALPQNLLLMSYYWLLSAEVDECWFKSYGLDTSGAAFRQTACVLSTNRLPPSDRRGPDIGRLRSCRREHARMPNR